MLVCADCRSELHNADHACASCGWTARRTGPLCDFLSSRDRSSAETAEYIDTYDTLAERNMEVPVESNRYVEHLSRRLADLLGDLSGKDFCDVGSGRGYLIKHAVARKARSVTAVDIAAPSLRVVADAYNVPGFLANAENLPFLRRFDVMAATDIVEHVLNMANFFVTANWSLRDNGILAVRVPYFENQLYYSNFHGLPVHYTHLRTFDRAILVDLVESFNFKVETVYYDGFNPNYMQAWLDRAPKLRDWLRDKVRARFGGDEDATTINPLIGRLVMKPIEIGVIARKTGHIEPVHAHKSLAKFYNERKQKAG